VQAQTTCMQGRGESGTAGSRRRRTQDEHVVDMEAQVAERRRRAAELHAQLQTRAETMAVRAWARSYPGCICMPLFSEPWRSCVDSACMSAGCQHYFCVPLFYEPWSSDMDPACMSAG